MSEHPSSREAPGYWDSVAEEWGESGRQAVWRAHSDAVNSKLARHWLPAGPLERLLKTDAFDEAVGGGLYPVLAERARRVTVIDVSDSALEAARRRYPALEGVQADARALPFAEGAFDAVFSNSTLDHFPSFVDIRGAVAELHRVLRPGGVLVITLDNLANPVVALRNALPFGLVARLGLVPVYVGATCGPRRLRRLLDESGFEVEEVSAVMHAPRVLAVPAAALLQRHGPARARSGFLGLLSGAEGLRRLPTRYLTGHFVAARACRR